MCIHQVVLRWMHSIQALNRPSNKRTQWMIQHLYDCMAFRVGLSRFLSLLRVSNNRVSNSRVSTRDRARSSTMVRSPELG